MKILYYHWGEYTFLDIINTFVKKRYMVDIYTREVSNKLYDEELMSEMGEKLNSESFDCIFSFNFIPVIAKVADKHGVKYVSWTYDSPCLTLYTDSIFLKCNYIFLFDKQEVEKLKGLGVTNVYHMPLAINADKMKDMFTYSIPDTGYKYDVSFVGNSYNDEYNFYDQIKNMPEYCRGFFDGIMDAQMNIYGYDLVSEMLAKQYGDVINKLVSITEEKEVFVNNIDTFIFSMQKKITVKERPEILKMISDEGISVAHFTKYRDERLDKVNFKGYVDYDKEMPLVFRESKINLNITLRCILSGISLRCIDIMGAGGFLLSNYQPELAEYFVDGEEVVMYYSRADMLDKIKYYLANEDERIAIAEKGNRKVINEFSYDILVERIFDICQIK